MKKGRLGLPQLALEEPAIRGLDLASFRERELPDVVGEPEPMGGADFEFAGYKVTFDDDGEVLVFDAKGRRLKGIPEKVRKHEEYQALMRGRKDDRSRARQAKMVLEKQMIEGSPLTAEHVSWLVEDHAYGPLLQTLVVSTPGEQTPVLLWTWDEAKGLGVLPPDQDARWIGWQDVEILHPLRLGDLTHWQDLVLELGRKQQLVQVFRELKAVPSAHMGAAQSSCLAGRETRSAAAIERTLMELGWVARRGTARRVWRVSLGDRRCASFEAWFDYGESFLPTDPTTTGDFGFFLPGSRSALPLGEVPRIVVSETLRSLEFACARAGASKEAEDVDVALAPPDPEGMAS